MKLKINKLPKDHDAFIFLNKLLKASIKNHIKISDSWEINKVHFEQAWEADQLDESVEEKYSIQVGNEEIFVELEDEEDIESLTNFYVKFTAKGDLSKILDEHGLSTELEVDFFSDVYGSNINLLSSEEVDNNVDLLTVEIKNKDLIEGILDKLNAKFGGLIL